MTIEEVITNDDINLDSRDTCLYRGSHVFKRIWNVEGMEVRILAGMREDTKIWVDIVVPLFSAYFCTIEIRFLLVSLLKFFVFEVIGLVLASPYSNE